MLFIYSFNKNLFCIHNALGTTLASVPSLFLTPHTSLTSLHISCFLSIYSWGYPEFSFVLLSSLSSFFICLQSFEVHFTYHKDHPSEAYSLIHFSKCTHSCATINTIKFWNISITPKISFLPHLWPQTTTGLLIVTTDLVV